MNDVEILKYKIEKVELPLVNCVKGNIDFDLSDFKNKIYELQVNVKLQNLNINNVDEFYKLRAKLNNFAKQINDEKKKVKNEYTKPYTDFEKQVKECIGLIEESSKFVDDQLKCYEEQQKQLLREDYIEMWKSFGKDSFVNYERIENPKWFLKSCSKKNVLVEMESINNKINADVTILKSAVVDEEEFKGVVKNYYETLDIGLVLGEYTKWKNIVKQEKIVVEQVENETLKTTQENTENATETKFNVLNEELKVEEQTKQVQAIISFTADEKIVDYVLELLEKNNIKCNFRKNYV